LEGIKERGKVLRSDAASEVSSRGTDPTRSWLPGEVIEGRYEVLGELTGGAMGQVYRVRHRAWGIELAIKSPQLHLIADEVLRERFIREAESWVDLGLHPHITTCYYVAQIEGIPRIVLEYVEGGTLRDWIGRGAFLQDWETPLGVAIQLCLGLEYAHSKGTIHRDLKPANVLMTKEGTPKLTDFGLVRRNVQEAEPAERTERPTEIAGGTQAGTILGTPEYMAPEQWIGAEQTGVHTDIYALGLILYELFCGRPPFELAEALCYAHPKLRQWEWKRMHSQAPIPDPHQWRRGLPEELAALLKDCLAKTPGDRPPGATAVRERLEAVYLMQLGRASPYLQAADAVGLQADNLNNRALSYLDLGRKAEAEAAWQSALNSDPQHPEVVYNRGLFLWRQGHLTDDMLVKQLEGVLATQGDQRQARYLLSLVHLERGEVDQALLLLEEAVRQAPREAELQAALKLVLSRARATRPFVPSLQGHTDSVNSVYLSPDGRRALSGSSDQTLRLWEVATGQCLRTFQGHTDSVTSVCLSPDGRRALSGSSDQTLRLWEVATGQCLRTFQGHTKGVTSVCLSPDGRWALSGSWDKTLRLWEVSTGRCAWTFQGYTKEVTSVCLSPDGRWALSGNSDQTLRLWEVSTGRYMWTFQGHTKGITSVCLSPDGRWALSGSWDKTLRLWEVSTGRCLRTFQKHTDWVTSVCLGPDGRWAVSGSGDHTVLFWELPNESICSFRLSRPRSHMELLEVQTRAGKLLKRAEEALGESDFARALTLVREARELPGCERTPQSMEAWTKLSLVCPRIGLRTAWLVRTFEGHKNEVNSVCLSADGRRALSGGVDTALRLWEVATGRCLRSFPGHTDSVLSVYLSADGRRALSGGMDRTVRLWDVATGRCLRTFEGHIHAVNSVCLSPDGRWALSAGGNNILLWEVTTGRCLRTFLGHKSGVSSISLSADGGQVLSGSGDKTLRLWQVATGRCLRTFEGHTSWVSSVCLSADGRFALSGSGDKALRLWQVATGRCLHTFEGHTDGVSSVCLSADGRFALSGSGDKTLRLWQVATGRCLRTFEGHTNWVRSVCLSTDGRWALSGGGDKALWLWQMDWELETRDPATWNEGALPYLKTFLTLHAPYLSPDPTAPGGLVRRGKPSWSEQDFQDLIRQLQCAGYGRLRPEGIRTRLEELTQSEEWGGSAEPPAGPAV